MGGSGPLICEPGGGGLFLPLFGDAEQHWDPKLRAALYFAGLLWTFLGVAIVADIFMAAIEQQRFQQPRAVDLAAGTRLRPSEPGYPSEPGCLQVTSKTRPITVTNKEGTSKIYHVQVTSHNFFSGDLGPSTIVGSAAYNLMYDLCDDFGRLFWRRAASSSYSPYVPGVNVRIRDTNPSNPLICDWPLAILAVGILAVCILVIPDGETRSIEQYGVFLTTASFSILAYLWLAYILLFSSPSIVEVRK
ncbi:hypothetical protein T492DRAFT_845170 [Pavlovales sp. CCMP2436]|nr:hypothetical protein T492DRAFT_845170 [Pavlovales sp. CCMP2436]